MSKKIIKDQFIGDKYSLTKVGEITKQMVGNIRVDIIYKDKYDNAWIESTLVGHNLMSENKTLPMVFLGKDIIDKIIEIYG